MAASFEEKLYVLERPTPLEHKKLMLMFVIMIMLMILMSPVGTKLKRSSDSGSDSFASENQLAFRELFFKMTSSRFVEVTDVQTTSFDLTFGE